MKLDVLIPTYNRATLLPRALESVLAADGADGLDVGVIVVDNRSTDDTRAIIESFIPRFGGRLHYVYESKPGRSSALNAGIAASRGDLVGMIDDDEEVDRGWLMTIASAFEDQATDFIGGPYLPRWGGERPAWLGIAPTARVVGWAECGQATQQFGPGCEAMLMGGNAVIRRSVLHRVGPYSVDLGRTPGRRLLSCEDEDMFDAAAVDRRARVLSSRPDHPPLRAAGTPDQAVLPPVVLLARRVTRRARPATPGGGAASAGRAPLHDWVAVRGTIDLLRPVLRRREPARTFKNELAWWDLAGFFYGKHSISRT